MGDFYVYIIFRRNGTPCYIGKGRGNRWRQHFVNCHNRRLGRLIKKEGDVPVVIGSDKLTNDEATSFESLLITVIGRYDTGSGPLFNLTDGGEGIVNPARETRLRMSNSAKKRIENNPEETVRRLRSHYRQLSDKLKGVPKSIESRQNMSKAWIGVKRGHYSPSQGIAISKKNTIYWASDRALGRRGFFWINNGTVCKQVRSVGEIPEGWSKGKINRRRTKVEITRVSRKEVVG